MAEPDADLDDPELNIILSTPDIAVARAIVMAVGDLNQEMGTEIQVEVCQGLRADLRQIDDAVKRLVDQQRSHQAKGIS
jgi:N-acyl-D-aspartate/D-glutamate deacylase